jgi:prophage regulatory protein
MKSPYLQRQANGDQTMKLLDYEALKERGICYSRPHLWRLWTKGQFPKPVKLSASRNVWLQSDIDAWIESRVAERDCARLNQKFNTQKMPGHRTTGKGS